MSTITLSRPISVKGESISELDLNLDVLTGKDLIAIEDAMRIKGLSTGAWDMSRSFLVRVAAKALALPPEALENLPVKDFMAIVNEVLVFFAQGASADSTDVNSETSSSASL